MREIDLGKYVLAQCASILKLYDSAYNSFDELRSAGHANSVLLAIASEVESIIPPSAQ